MHSYFETQTRNRDRIVRSEPASVLLPLVDRLYEVALRLIPPTSPFGQFVLMGHKEFLAAASLLVQAQPEDAMPITRRAIEMARVAAAGKSNPTYANEWLAFERRHARWEARQRGEKPQRLAVDLPADHPLVLDLWRTYGILSDAGVHFTPEYVGSLDWEQRPGQRFLNYFTRDARTIRREIILLAGIHAKILLVLDACLDGTLRNSNDWVRLMAELERRGTGYAAEFRDTLNPDDDSSRE